MSSLTDEIYNAVLSDLEAAFNKLVERVPPPQRLPFGDGFVYRYVERTVQQALIQKLARMLTGLRAAHVLLRQGLIQEQAVIQRVLGDLQEDIFFLGYSIVKGELTKAHEEFLTDFYQEEFDNPKNVLQSTQKRRPVPRRKIQAYLASIDPNIANPSHNQRVIRTLQQAFSGFVHAASSQIMDMYGGDPPQFHVSGMLGTWRMPEFEYDIWNYFERAFAAFAFVAMAFGDQELANRILSQQQTFHIQTGRND